MLERQECGIPNRFPMGSATAPPRCTGAGRLRRTDHTAAKLRMVSVRIRLPSENSLPVGIGR